MITLPWPAQFMKQDTAKTTDHESESLPALFARLADETTRLVDAKLALLKIELKEEAAAYIRGTVMILVGSVVALVGFALLNVAIAFLISTLFNGTSLSQPARYAVGFLITATVYLILGTALIVVSKNKLAAEPIIPERTVRELKRDKKALETNI
jgi:uncharacterized membrane protein YqjE